MSASAYECAAGLSQLDCDALQYPDWIPDSGTASSCSSESTGSLSGSGNESKVWDWLIKKGMTEKGAAGIMGNMSVESGFNPFRIQTTATLRTYDAMVGTDAKDNAFGLVQWDSGRRVLVLKALSAINADYKSYVADKYGKEIANSSNAPVEINDAFIQIELNYMYKESTPGGGRSTTWSSLLKAQSPEAAANVFEEIFEGSTRDPGGPHATAAKTIYNNHKGTASGDTLQAGCDDGAAAGLVSGGMTEDQAKDFMQQYIDYAKGKSGSGLKPASYNGRSFQLYYSGCSEGPLANCSTFSEFFVGAYTTGEQAFPRGGLMVEQLLGTHSGFIDGGHIPKVYAIFSRASGGGGNGHTGVVLGIDKANGKIIIGQASCGESLTLDVAVDVLPLNEWTGNTDYTYAYTDNILVKGFQ